MRSHTTSLALAAADDNGICESQTPAAGGVQALTINGDLATGGVATMDVPRHVSITSAADETGRTFTVTGTDRYGNAISEEITGADTAAANGTRNFATVTEVLVDDDTAGAITVGSADEAEGPWIPLDHYRETFSASLLGKISAGASLTYGVEYTLSEVNSPGFQEDDAIAQAHATVTAKTADFAGSQDLPIDALRLAVSGHASGSVDLHIQPGGW